MGKLSESIAYIFKIVLIGIFSMAMGVIIAFPLTLVFGEESFARASAYSAVFSAAYGGYEFRKVEESGRY